MTIQQHPAAGEGANAADRAVPDHASRRRFLQSGLAAAAATMTTSGFLSLGGECFFEHEDRILIFYTGLDETSASGFPGVTSGPIATGLATLPKDGFAFLRAADPVSRGTMTTKPIRVKNASATKLSLNISHTAPWRDWVEVEVLDARSLQPIRGYDRDGGRVMRDGTGRTVQWRDRATLAAVGVSDIRLRFHFYGAARLYSYTFLTT